MLDNSITLIDADDKLPADITFKNVAVLMACVIKHDPKILFEEALFVK